jgi:hypothetical protein
LGKVIFFGMGINPKGLFLGGMGRKSLAFSQGRKVGFFNFPRNWFLVVWDGVVGERGWVYIFLSFFSSVIW